MANKPLCFCEHLFKFIIIDGFYENFFKVHAKNLQKVVDSGQKWVYDICVIKRKGSSSDVRQGL